MEISNEEWRMTMDNLKSSIDHANKLRKALSGLLRDCGDVYRHFGLDSSREQFGLALETANARLKAIH